VRRGGTVLNFLILTALGRGRLVSHHRTGEKRDSYRGFVGREFGSSRGSYKNLGPWETSYILGYIAGSKREAHQKKVSYYKGMQ
jgi:hypothetical protein